MVLRGSTHDSGGLEYYGATKRAHPNRDQIARTLGLIRQAWIFSKAVWVAGSAFAVSYIPKHFVICAAAVRFGRPVRWIEDRREHLLSANQSRQQTHRIRAAIDADGRILGIDNEFFHDQGAYLRTHGVRVPDMTAGLMLATIRGTCLPVAGHVRLTNKTPAAAIARRH